MIKDVASQLFPVNLSRILWNLQSDGPLASYLTDNDNNCKFCRYGSTKKGRKAKNN